MDAVKQAVVQNNKCPQRSLGWNLLIYTDFMERNVILRAIFMLTY
jgi:hypothetical protein